MFRHRELGLIQAYQIGVTLLMTVLFWGYFLVLDYALPGFGLTGFSDYFNYYLATTLGFQISFLSSRQHNIFSVSSGIVESHRFIWGHIVFATAITCMFLVLKRDEAISRFFLFTYLPLAYVVLVVFNRYFAFGLLRRFIRSEPQSLLLIGKPAEVLKAEWLLSKAKIFGMETVGILSEAPADEIPFGIRKLGSPDEIEQVLEQFGIGNIFILGSPRDRRALVAWMRIAESRGCRVSLVNDLEEFLQRRVNHFRCDNMDLIEIREEPLQNFVNRLLKRVTDVAISLPVVCFVLPVLMLVVWLIQFRQAPGPLFFRQKRSGIDNAPFTILKFRTMYADRCGSSAQVTADDERIYPAGRVLRRYSLDEFPQFLNVLFGHMSVVGPRPHMRQHDAVFAEAMTSYRIRSFVKPGLSGLAQTRGFRGEAISPEDIVQRVECDIEYIETWSLALDVRIIYLTILQMIRPPKSAY